MPRRSGGGAAAAAHRAAHRATTATITATSIGAVAAIAATDERLGHGGGARALVDEAELVPREEQRQRRARGDHARRGLAPASAERVRRGVAEHVDEHAAPRGVHLAPRAVQRAPQRGGRGGA